MREKVVFILGTGHCGSTDNTESVVSFDYHRFPGSKIFENRANLYKNIFNFSKANVLVDSSKNLFWINRGIKHLQDSNLEPVLIYLVREPKAVVNSYYRKYKTSKKLSEVAGDIKQRIEKNDIFFEQIKKCNKLKFSYEDICRNPQEELMTICKYIGVEYQPEMLNYWKFDHYNISGNSGTNSLIEKYKNQEVQVSENRYDQGFYKDHPLSIRLDERWKNELTSEQKELIDKILES